MKSLLKLLCLLTLLSAQIGWAKLRDYHFDIDYYSMNQTGLPVEALAVQQQIPGPVITATVGDTLRVTFTNRLNEETSIHWHGILLPNDQDGVPYLTTSPIRPGESLTYEYPVKHSGTYWYHSHSGLQEQRGIYGALVFYPKDYPKGWQEHVLVLSDWSDEHPNHILANLKKDDHYYELKKDSVQSWDKVLAHGEKAIKNRLKASWTRMGPMDISDVGYDAFLVNGKRIQNIKGKAGESIKLRLINAGASTYFKTSFAGGPMTVVASDGVDVEPFEVDELTLSIAETYDVIVTLPENKTYEFRATSEDGTGYSSTFIGQGPKVYARDYIPPNVFLASHDHSGHDMSAHEAPVEEMSMHEGHDMPMDHSMHNMMDHSMHTKPSNDDQHTPVKKDGPRYTAGHDYDRLRAKVDTSFDEQPLKEVFLDLTGFMDGYVWHFNHVPLSGADKILIQKGQRVRFILTNKTMMHHPVHLHGHFFRVLNKHGDYSPLKHTVNVPAMGQQIIEFDANEEKDWFFHCHNLYHMKSGMSRIISYGQQKELGEYLEKNLIHDDKFFHKGDIQVLSQMLVFDFEIFNHKHTLIGVEFDWDWDKRYDIELYYEKYLTRFLSAFTGVNFEREDEHESAEDSGIFGLRYTLPLLIDSELRINTRGDLRLQLGSHLQLFKRVSFDWMWNTDKEYRLGFHVTLSKRWDLMAAYDSDDHFGVGVKMSL